jgi:hypothetical protein
MNRSPDIGGRFFVCGARYLVVVRGKMTDSVFEIRVGYATLWILWREPWDVCKERDSKSLGESNDSEDDFVGVRDDGFGRERRQRSGE